MNNNFFIQDTPIDTLEVIKKWARLMSLVDFEGVYPEVAEDISYIYHLFMQDVAIALDNAITKLDKTS